MRAYGATVLRLSAGAVFLVHGAQKLFGVPGGPGLAGTSRMLASFGLPYPSSLAVALGVGEFGGGVLLILGSLTFWVSLVLLVDMALTVWKVHYPHGFTLSGGLTPGHGSQPELHLLLIGALVCLMLGGPGALSLDDQRTRNAEAQARGRARIRKV
ncbi:MAG TPA: DoxX family protein [Vicinamibacterales bacterium]|jgi:putative oxidoreductase